MLNNDGSLSNKASDYIVWDPIRNFSGIFDGQGHTIANRDFTDLEGEPQHFFDRGKSTIDMDIVYNPVDQKYHAFYKNEGDGGICKVTANTLMPASGKATGSQWSKPSNHPPRRKEATSEVDNEVRHGL